MRIRSALVTRLLAGLVVTAAVMFVPALPASADESACLGTFYASNGRELFTPETRFVPPPLRAFPADCASRVSSEPFGDGLTVTAGYNMLYIDISWDEFVAIIRSFETGGWGAGFITTIDTGTGQPDYETTWSADDLAALPNPPDFARGRFSNAADGKNIITVNYTDGQRYQNDGDITVPSLVLEVLISQPFGGASIADPSMLSTLRTLADVRITPAQASVVAASAVVLMLVVGYPGALLSGVIGERYEQVRAWIQKRRSQRATRRADKDAARAASPAATLEHGLAGPRKLPGWLVFPGLAIAAVVAGFVDPAFGPNLMSARVLVTSFLTLLLFNAVTAGLVRVILSRIEPSSAPELRFRWGSLVILAAAVALARLLELQPGVIFGLVVGLVFAVTLATSRKAIVVLLGSLFALVFALLAWVVYSALAPLAVAAPGNGFLVFAAEFFSGITVEGISSLPIALLPLLALDGMALFAWKKWIWAVAYVIGLAAFMLVLLTIPDSWGEVTDYVRWVGIFVVFAVIAVGVWAINFAVERRKHHVPLGHG